MSVIEGGVNAMDNVREASWLEGLLLLAILAIVIFISAQKGSVYHIIPDQEVSMWSGEVDNLEQNLLEEPE